MTWKDGDWCFFEFKLCQIKVEGDKVREASDGMFSTHGNNLADRCVPLTLRNANIAQHAQYWSDELHEKGHNGLNYPDMHNKLVELWVEASTSETDAIASQVIADMGEFVNNVLKAVTAVPSVQGVRLLRHQRA